MCEERLQEAGQQLALAAQDELPVLFVEGKSGNYPYQRMTSEEANWARSRLHCFANTDLVWVSRCRDNNRDRQRAHALRYEFDPNYKGELVYAAYASHFLDGGYPSSCVLCALARQRRKTENKKRKELEKKELEKKANEEREMVQRIAAKSVKPSAPPVLSAPLVSPVVGNGRHYKEVFVSAEVYTKLQLLADAYQVSVSEVVAQGCGLSMERMQQQLAPPPIDDSQRFPGGG